MAYHLSGDREFIEGPAVAPNKTSSEPLPGYGKIWLTVYTGLSKLPSDSPRLKSILDFWTKVVFDSIDPKKAATSTSVPLEHDDDRAFMELFLDETQPGAAAPHSQHSQERSRVFSPEEYDEGLIANDDIRPEDSVSQVASQLSNTQSAAPCFTSPVLVPPGLAPPGLELPSSSAVLDGVAASARPVSAAETARQAPSSAAPVSRAPSLSRTTASSTSSQRILSVAAPLDVNDAAIAGGVAAMSLEAVPVAAKLGGKAKTKGRSKTKGSKEGNTADPGPAPARRATRSSKK